VECLHTAVSFVGVVAALVVAVADERCRDAAAVVTAERVRRTRRIRCTTTTTLKQCRGRHTKQQTGAKRSEKQYEEVETINSGVAEGPRDAT